jgi:hypothetical protein
MGLNGLLQGYLSFLLIYFTYPYVVQHVYLRIEILLPMSVITRRHI